MRVLNTDMFRSVFLCLWQRNAGSTALAFETWCLGARSEAMQARRKERGSRHVWMHWCIRVKQARNVGHFCEQILRRGVDSCFFAWKALTDNFRVEGILCAEIDCVARSLARQVNCSAQGHSFLLFVASNA